MSIERISTQTRREQIAEAALNLIASQGIAFLSMAVLARRIGVVPSAIYRHFDSKDKYPGLRARPAPKEASRQRCNCAG